MKKLIKGNTFFVLGAFCFLIANVPNLYGALVLEQFAPTGFISLVQLGLTFYLLDSIFEDRPKVFVLVGSINWSLNFIVLILGVIA